MAWLTFGVSTSDFPVRSVLRMKPSEVPGVCSMPHAWCQQRAQDLQHTGCEGAWLRSAWHSTRSMFAVGHALLRSRQYPPCRRHSRLVLGLMDAMRSVPTVCSAPGPTATPDCSPRSWAVGLTLWAPPNHCSPLQPQYGPHLAEGQGQSRAWLPAPSLGSWGGQAGCPCRTCRGRGIRVEVLVTQMSGEGEQWFPW